MLSVKKKMTSFLSVLLHYLHELLRFHCNYKKLDEVEDEDGLMREVLQRDKGAM